MTWNVKQQPPHSNRRQLLADALREIDLGGLSDRLLNEPNTTGGPSRLLESQTKPPSAESQTKPLSPELVERCTQDFKFKYRSTLCKIRTDPLNPASTVQFKDMYTNLVLKEEHGTDKQMLGYNDILDLEVNGEFPKRIMVQGEAGAGKTTFCAKIAWDWIEGKYFSHFVWVLIVPLREFKQHTIGKIAKSYLAKNNPATVSQITEYIRSNPDKVFIAFDGLDEVGSKIMKTEFCESQPTDQTQLQPSQPSVTPSEACGSSSETDDIRLVDILCSDQLASCPVLVTTRPWRAVEIRSDGDLMKLYTFIHIEGFNRKNLSVYIHKYFPKNEDKANRLIQFTSENDVISENMAHYPIYVAMLCLMWKERDKQKLKEMKSLKSFSQIFKEIIAFLKEHYAQKEVKKVGSPSLHAYLKKIDELLGPIAKQALNGLLENTFVFGEDDFEICQESKDIACRVGILSQEDKIPADMDTHERNSHVQLPVFFPHKLFQEYMAGVHLASLYETDRNEFNRLIEQVVLRRKKKFKYLLYFTVSQNKSIATHVMNSMLQRLNGDMIFIGEALRFIFDVAFESQDSDVAALVKDRVLSEKIELVISKYMTAHTVAGYAFIGPHMFKKRI
ncbi:protein NLRC5-like [Strongylocentrotus purpuratus]|uniref:NACHT domain-containing protein n=1 Tax=Strongylocentrotus purpuratus TaxID=7668 RepID=A0A7M7SVP1_STRPU|nr:protein NLRC5-like [Strongylocentrotus purpuratus]